MEIRDKPGIPHPNAIHIPARDGKQARTVDGFQAAESGLGWFGRLLARTGAANLTALAGGGPQTAQYLTTRQGRHHYDVPTFAATSSMDDADIEVGGTKFVGTDHVFRMGSVRTEAFSGMAEHLYELVKKGRAEEYRQAAFLSRSSPHNTHGTGRWNGPISFHDDGTVMAASRNPTSPGRTQRAPPLSRRPVGVPSPMSATVKPVSLSQVPCSGGFGGWSTQSSDRGAAAAVPAERGAHRNTRVLRRRAPPRPVASPCPVALIDRQGREGCWR
ncbi:hypothetical protein ACWDZ4_08060 [Streptomyces sp. NPDC003016]